MEYRSVKDLNDRIVDWSRTLPRDLDLVVGIPRSGLLAANLLALHLNLPMTDLAGLLEGRVIANGVRYAGPGGKELLQTRANIIVVDDSVFSGGALEKARKRIRIARLPHTIRYGAVFVTPEAVKAGKVEWFAEVVPGPRVFEWNVMHTPLMSNYCVDIDGVLLRGEDSELSGDALRVLGPRTDGPLFLTPRYEIGWLVTTRSEDQREKTETWLDEQGVRFRELVMQPGVRDPQEGGTPLDSASFKAAVYLETGADLFLEGVGPAAAEIARLSGKPVFSLETREMIYPGNQPRRPHPHVRPPHPTEKALRWLSRLPGRAFRKAKRGAWGMRSDPPSRTSGSGVSWPAEPAPGSPVE
ncbi:phosphoribosyltransferase family protein [soil metagenome]